jgi:FtsP/CotA-like multicopper oxidase with cupredoxin domain
LKEAEHARNNRIEVVKEYSQGRVTRRDLIKWGLISAAGLLVPKSGFSPFARSAYGASTITGAPPSPAPAHGAFSQAMPLFEVFDRKPVSDLNPYPTWEANTTYNPVTGGPLEGRPPGPMWAHQRWEEFYPKVAVECAQSCAQYNPKGSYRCCFHPDLPDQDVSKLWTFGGTIPPKLLLARYGEPVLFRHHNELDSPTNGGFGRYSITTHNHNGHNGGESDGFAGAFFFPGQFYDYHWPIVLAGHDTINVDAKDPRAGGPDDSGGVYRIPGDWRETMSTHWFHDHMIDFTSQNVYKGNAAMMNLYSAVDRGNEAVNDGVNLRLPSGTAKSWGNLDYDVNLVIADKAWDRDGQLLFDIFNFDGFLGDMMTVNFAYKPYFEVERRKYRFRILNGGVARYLQLCLSDNSPMTLIANDGNLMAQPVVMRELPQQGIAERYDIVIDFSRYPVGWKVWMVNLLEHDDGRGPKGKLSLRDALSGKSDDPCVGKFLEFRIKKNPSKPDLSQVPAQLIPLPERKPVVRERTFEFGRSGGSDSTPWTIKVDGGAGLGALVSRISAAPQPNTAEIWHLVNGGGGWDHPVHIHFEEGQVLARNGSAANVPAWERGARKDVYRLGEGGSVTVYMQFREFMGTYVEHCHNTTHEDHAMLLRWDLNGGLVPMPTPVPTPTGVTYLASTTLENESSSGSGSSSLSTTSTSSTSTTTSSTTGKKGRRR